MELERRRTKRLQPHKEIQLIFTCTTAVVGLVHDISAYGLSIEYEGPCKLDMGREINISLVNGVKDAEVIGDLQCIPVYNIATLAHGRSFSGKDVHLLGMAYGQLNQAHHAKLNRLLDSLT